MIVLGKRALTSFAQFDGNQGRFFRRVRLENGQIVEQIWSSHLKLGGNQATAALIT